MDNETKYLLSVYEAV